MSDNKNYLAFVAEVEKTVLIPGADKIHTAIVLGSHVIVSKEVGVGDVGLFFPPETQLSNDFLRNNNLYRISANNKDTDKKGFFENNARVRVQKFLQQKSEGFFIGLHSLGYTDYDVSKLKVGDSFDKLGKDKALVTKYVSEKTRRLLNSRNSRKQGKVKIEAPTFVQHVETSQLKYYAKTIKKGSLITISAKCHGTSSRHSLSKTYRPLPFWKSLINLIRPTFEDGKYEYLVGTRRVNLYEDRKSPEGFHGSDEFRFEWLENLKPFLNKGLIVFGELVGSANGKQIMPNHDVTKLKDKDFVKKYGETVSYNYNTAEGENDLIIYRIAQTCEDGSVIDYTWDQIKHWCVTNGFKHVIEIEPPFIFDGDTEAFLEKVSNLTERKSVLTEDYYDTSIVSEGVVVRVDNMHLTPHFYKNKSWAFKLMEGILKEEIVDPEDIS